MDDLLKISALRFVPGGMYGVAPTTALLTLEVNGTIPGDLLDQLASRDSLNALNQTEPLSGLGQGDWLSHFLVGGRGESRLADVIAALIVVVQLWARSPVHKAQVISASTDRIRLAVPWWNRILTRDAADLVAGYLSAVAAFGMEDGTARARRHLDRVLRQAQPEGLSPNSLRFARSAMARGMPVTLLNGRTLQIGWGANARQFMSSFTDQTPALGERLSRHKFHCNRRLARAAVPVPDTRLVQSLPQARAAAEALGWPVVVKPVAADQGRGVHVGVGSFAALEHAFRGASDMQDHGVLVEELVPGDDYRILVADGRMVMACRRIPGGVTGDGTSTVNALLDRLNADPLRGTDLRSALVRISPDSEALSCLEAAGLTPDSIPQEGRFVPLRRTANISTGGTAVDVTDLIHPDNQMVAVRAARIARLDIAGVDFLCPDIGRSYREVGGAICEVNGQPGFRPHWLSAPGRDVNGDILDILFEDHPARIPTAAITGTNGKSTTARMLHHIWQTAGKTAGVCTTAGTWVGPDRIDTKNLSGVPGAALLFSDPAVEAAVLEMPRKGLILYGQACDHYDVAAFLNVQDDHIGQDGIKTLEDMARLKTGVIQRAREAVVVNAEDPLCLQALGTAVARRQILVAMRPDTTALADHLTAGGDGIFVAAHEGADWIISARGAQRIPVIKVGDIPATLGGRLRFNIMNAMFATALADAQGLSASAIRTALASFEASREMNLGRYNIIDGLPFQLIVDFAHNEPGVTEFCRFVRDLPVTGRRHLAVQILGNSGPYKLEATAADLVETFDQICVIPNLSVIRKHSYYKSQDPEGEMLQTCRAVLHKNGATGSQIMTSQSEDAILDQILSIAEPGDLVALLVGADVAYRYIDKFRTQGGSKAGAESV